jgi:hypothetical protein
MFSLIWVHKTENEVLDPVHRLPHSVSQQAGQSNQLQQRGGQPNYLENNFFVAIMIFS